MLLALDPSTRTGWAICEPFTDRPVMRCGSLHIPSGTNLERAAALGSQLIRLVKEEKITRAAVEIPMSAPPAPRKVQKVTALGFETEMAVQGNISTQNLLWCLHGSIGAILGAFRIPTHIVGMKEWRKHTLGNGNIPGAESKRRCKSLLESMGVYVANQDEAEAGGILLWLNGHERCFREEDALRARAA